MSFSVKRFCVLKLDYNYNSDSLIENIFCKAKKHLKRVFFFFQVNNAQMSIHQDLPLEESLPWKNEKIKQYKKMARDATTFHLVAEWYYSSFSCRSLIGFFRVSWAEGQWLRTRQLSHCSIDVHNRWCVRSKTGSIRLTRGCSALHLCWPNPTNTLLNSSHKGLKTKI